MTAWLVLASAGLCTFLLRWGVVLVAASHPIPERVVGATALVAPAIAAALLAAAFTRAGGLSELSLHVVVVAVGFLIALRTRSVLMTLAAGVAVYAVVAILG